MNGYGMIAGTLEPTAAAAGGTPAAAAAADRGDAASAAESISVAGADGEEEEDAQPLTEDDAAACRMHQPLGNLDITDAAISQDVHAALDDGGWPWRPG